MTVRLVRTIGAIVLSGQLLPVGLPLVCEPVQRVASQGCEQPMAAPTASPAVSMASEPVPCPNPAFCAVSATAAPVFGRVVAVAMSESHLTGSALTTFVPADPQAPLPPPPQA